MAQELSKHCLYYWITSNLTIGHVRSAGFDEYSQCAIASAGHKMDGTTEYHLTTSNGAGVNFRDKYKRDTGSCRKPSIIERFLVIWYLIQMGLPAVGPLSR